MSDPKPKETTANNPTQEGQDVKKEPREYTVIAEKVKGIVKWFSVKNSYGFICHNDSNEDVFVHSRRIKRNNPRKLYKTLAEGEEVEFDLIQGTKGKEAINVTGPDGKPVRGSPYAANKPHRRWSNRNKNNRRRNNNRKKKSEENSGDEKKEGETLKTENEESTSKS